MAAGQELQPRLSVEEGASCHGSTFGVGVQGFYVDAMGRQSAADLADDSWTVVAHELKMKGGSNGWLGWVFMLNGNGEAHLIAQACECGQEFFLAFAGNVGAQDASKPSAEVAHPAFEPVAVVGPDKGGDGINQAGFIFSDDRHDKGARGHSMESRA